MPQNLRYMLSLFSDSQVPHQPVFAKINETFVFWGAADPKYKLLIVAVPLSIMVSTIVIILVALYLARPLKWSYENMSFDPTSIIHLIIACSIGQLDPLQFKGYDEANTYDRPNDVKFGLAEMPRYKCREGFKLKQRGNSRNGHGERDGALQSIITRRNGELTNISVKFSEVMCNAADVSWEGLGDSDGGRLVNDLHVYVDGMAIR